MRAAVRPRTQGVAWRGYYPFDPPWNAVPFSSRYYHWMVVTITSRTADLCWPLGRFSLRPSRRLAALFPLQRFVAAPPPCRGGLCLGPKLPLRLRLRTAELFPRSQSTDGNNYQARSRTSDRFEAIARVSHRSGVSLSDLLLLEIYPQDGPDLPASPRPGGTFST